MTDIKAKDTMEKVSPDDMPDLIGKRVHLGWASVGCNWRVLEYFRLTGAVHLETPKTKKKRIADVDDVYFTRKEHARKLHRDKRNEKMKS